MKSSPLKIQEFSTSPDEIDSIFGSSSSSSSGAAAGAGDFPAFGVETPRTEPVQQPAVAQPPASKALDAARKPIVQFKHKAKSYDPFDNSGDILETAAPTSAGRANGESAGANAPPATKGNLSGSADTVDATETAADSTAMTTGRESGMPQVLTPSGSEAASATNQQARPAIVARPPVDVADGFNPLDLSSYGIWIWIPVAMLTLFAFGLFRWVMGTSSSDDLARYKYRGPKVADRDAPDVRGRFKKCCSTSEHGEPTTVAAASGVASLVAVTAAEDDFDFFDDEFASTPMVEAVELPLAASSRASDSLPAVHADSMATTTDLDGVLPAATTTDSAPSNPTRVANITNETTSSAMVDLNNSDDDFDYLADDGTFETVAGDVEPAAEVDSGTFAAESADQSTVAVNGFDAEATAEGNEFDLTQPEAQADDDDIDFFDDDSDAGFSFDDGDLAEETVAAEASDAVAWVGSQLSESANAAAVIESGEKVAASDFSDSEEFADADVMASDLEDGVGAVVETYEGASAATVTNVATVAVAAAGGSWLSRLFGRRKLKAAVDDSIVEEADHAIAAVQNTPSVSGLEREGAIDVNSIDTESTVADDDGLATIADGPAASDDDGDFSDVSSAASEEADDDFGMFDDDSDANYEFDSDGDQAVVASAVAMSVAPDTDADATSLDGNGLTADEKDEGDDVNSLTAASGVDDELGDLDDSDSFDALFDDEDDELKLEPAATVDVADDAEALAELTDDVVAGELDTMADVPLTLAAAVPDADDNAELSLAGEDLGDVTATSESSDELDLESELDLQIESLKVPAAHDERPLLEDQLLDDIVHAGSDATPQTQAPSGGLGLAAAGMAAVGSVAGIGSVANGSSNSDAAELVELRARIATLESANESMEQELVQAKDTLASTASDQTAADEAVAKLAGVEEALATAELQERQLRAELTTAEESKQNALNAAEEANAEIEQAKAEADEARAAIEAAKTEAEQASAEAEQAKAQIEAATAEAEQAKAAVDELAAQAEQAKANAEAAAAEAAQARADLAAADAAASLVTADPQSAGGGLAAMAATSAVGSDAAGSESDVDDPFRLPPEKVKVMLKKLKTERKKRLKTKEYLLAAQAKQNEVTEALAKVNAELESLKLQVSGGSLAAGSSGEDELTLGQDGQLASLQSKLDAAEDELKKN